MTCPLPLNALIQAWNQELNPDPLIDPDTDKVHNAPHSLRRQSLVRPVSSADSRVQALGVAPTESFDGTAVE